MKITYFGHSCFLIESSKGKRVIFDPFPPDLGYKEIKIKNIDLALISHNHFDHNYIKSFEKPFMVIRKPGIQKACGLEINGIKGFHDNKKGELRGKNNIYYLNIDGIKIAHFGDIGDIDIDLPKCDIAFIPIGGRYTINSDEALRLSEKIDTRLFFPMHYKTKFVDFPIDEKEVLLNHKMALNIDSASIEINKENLKSYDKGSILFLNL